MCVRQENNIIAAKRNNPTIRASEIWTDAAVAAAVRFETTSTPVDCDVRTADSLLGAKTQASSCIRSSDDVDATPTTIVAPAAKIPSGKKRLFGWTNGALNAFTGAWSLPTFHRYCHSCFHSPLPAGLSRRMRRTRCRIFVVLFHCMLAERYQE